VFVPQEKGLFEVRRVGRGSANWAARSRSFRAWPLGETLSWRELSLLKAEGEKAEGEGGHHDH
jgi:hypothetical protein